MSYNIIATPNFSKELKKLAKKYPSIKSDYQKILDDLTLNPKLGTLIRPDCYKIRLSIASKGKGKSSGARVITKIILISNDIYLLTIFDKSDKITISNKELDDLLNQL